MRSSNNHIMVAAAVNRAQRCGSADRASRHDDEAVKESGSTPQSLQDSKEIIDMVGTQNEKKSSDFD